MIVHALTRRSYQWEKEDQQLKFRTPELPNGRTVERL